MRNAYENWKISIDNNLEDVYTTFSDRKVDAMRYCKDLEFCMCGKMGELFHIIQ